MDAWVIPISIIAAIGLFTHSLESFSNNLKEQVNENIRSTLQRFTMFKMKGSFTGFAGTAVIQSSSALVAITVSFVDSGVISFQNSLPILLGSNIGTTITAWLVSFSVFHYWPWALF